MLKKEVFDSPKAGWMAPDGTFFATEYMEHIATAREIYQLLNHGEEYIPEDADRQLVAAGWVSIHIVTFLEHGLILDYDRHLTAEQKREIKPVFEDFPDRFTKSARADLEEELYR